MEEYWFMFTVNNKDSEVNEDKKKKKTQEEEQKRVVGSRGTLTEEHRETEEVKECVDRRSIHVINFSSESLEERIHVCSRSTILFNLFHGIVNANNSYPTNICENLSLSMRDSAFVAIQSDKLKCDEAINSHG
jgi:hypothetical protein